MTKCYICGSNNAKKYNNIIVEIEQGFFHEKIDLCKNCRKDETKIRKSMFIYPSKQIRDKIIIKEEKK